ncbi:ABC-type dipeptide/oligopeptide/nickel transport system permease component [Bradyrhizobium sp. LA7.1]
MKSLLLRRLAVLLPTLLLVSMMVFGLQKLLPAILRWLSPEKSVIPKSLNIFGRSIASMIRSRCNTPSG